MSQGTVDHRRRGARAAPAAQTHYRDPSSWCCDWRDEAGNPGRQAPGGNGYQEKLHKSGGEEGGVEADGGGEEAPSERSGWDRPVDEGPEYVVDSSEQLGGDELLS